MRVLHVTSTFPVADGGTTGPFLADLVAAERDAGMDVRVVAPHAAGVSPTVGGVAVRRFRYGPVGLEVLGYGAGLMAEARGARAALVPGFVAAMSVAAFREARRWGADVVHAHWWLPGGLAALPAGRPLVVTLHGSDVALASRRGVAPVARRVLRGATVLAVSEALASEASHVIGIDGVEVAVMPVTIEPGPRAASDRFLAVGRLAPEKGFDVLIAAVARSSSLAVDIVGDGPLRAALERQAAPLGPRVRFLGALSRPSYHVALRSARALVVPSRREGMGLVAVEAVLVGTPVIASAVGGLPIALGAPGAGPGPVPGGLLVAASDPVALAAALSSPLRPPSAAAVEAAARHRPAAVAARHAALYEVASARAPRR